MNNDKIIRALVILGVMLLFALSGSFLATIIFIFYLVHFLLTYIIPIINKSSLNKKNMQDEPIIVKNPFSFSGLDRAKKYTTAIIVLVIGVILLAASLVVVEAGYTGVYSLFGKVKDAELRSGLHIVNPLAKMTNMSIRTEEYTMSIVSNEGKKTRSDAISALTKEGLSVDLDITVLYHLAQERASDIYRDVGLTYEEKIIRPEIRSAIREIIAQYEAKDIYSEKRQEAAQKILTVLQNKTKIRGIEVEDVLLRNVVLPPSLATAIQQKLEAEQESQKYEFLLQKEEKEADRVRIKAVGQKDAQKTINESLTTNYLYYLYINELKDRQGTIYVPTNPSTGMPLFRDVGM